MATFLEQCLVTFLTLALGIRLTASQFRQTYKSSISLREKLQGDTFYLQCIDGLAKHAKLYTEPESQTRGPAFAMLDSRIPWAPGNKLALGILRNITEIEEAPT